MLSHLLAFETPQKDPCGQSPQSWTPPQPSGIEPHSAPTLSQLTGVQPGGGAHLKGSLAPHR